MKDKIVKLKRFEKKLSARNIDKFEEMFMKFYKTIEKDNSKFSNFSKLDIDYEEFMRLAKEYLIETFEYSVKSAVDMYTRLFGWKLSRLKLAEIKDKMLSEYNKKYAAAKVVQITDTTRNILNNVLKEAQSDGLSSKSTVSKILESVEGMSKTRAKTIGRTETSSSVNNTSLRTAKEAKMKEKGWIHIGGQYASRDNHMRLNGKFIKIDDYWDLGKGIKCKCPHDPMLPASEVVNCNCLQIYR